MAFKATDAYKSGMTDATYGQGISWVAYVLPFIEQSALHSQINFNIASITTSSDPNASLAVSRRVNELYCPSLATLADVRQAGSATPTSAAQTMNYFGVMGIVVPSSLAGTYPKYSNGGTWPQASRPSQGIFGVAATNSAVSLQPRGAAAKDVTDGLSKTYLLGEIAWSGMGRQGNFNVLSYLIGYNGWGLGQFINPVRNIYYSRPNNISKAEVAGGLTVPSDGQYNNMNWGSNHPGGTNFVMGDGSVTFVNDAIDMNVFMAAGSKSSADEWSRDSTRWRARPLKALRCDGFLLRGRWTPRPVGSCSPPSSRPVVARVTATPSRAASRLTASRFPPARSPSCRSVAASRAERPVFVKSRLGRMPRRRAGTLGAVRIA